ncbi:MAG: DUF2946 family protein [Rhodomicrobium sp.]
MRSRRWVSWIAVIGMLLHAATLARHNALLFKQATLIQEAALGVAFEPGAICHAGGGAQENGKAQGAPGKSPAGAPTHCPVCLGLVSAHATPPSEAPVLRVPRTVIAFGFASRDPQLAPLPAVRRPSNRGPPSIA